MGRNVADREYRDEEDPIDRIGKKVGRKALAHSVLGWADIASGGLTLPIHAAYTAKDVVDVVSIAKDVKDGV